MSSITKLELKDLQSEDIADVLQKVEKSFDIQFDGSELKDVKTFGELCDIIKNKVQGVSIYDCSTQQAFYKLRDAIASTSMVNKDELTVHTQLKDIFPRNHRRHQIRELQKALGFKTDILRPKHFVYRSLFALLLLSLIGLFFYVQIALMALVLSIAGIRLAEKFGKEFDPITVGDLAEKITLENYKNVRRNYASRNPEEVSRIVKELFKRDLLLEDKQLMRDATFV